MNQVINTIITGLNDIGRGFWDYSAGIFIQSSILIIFLLIIDFLLRKRVRATFRYWIWMLVFIKLILPPSLSLPTGIGYWRGDILYTTQPVLEGQLTSYRHESTDFPLLIDETPLLFEIPQTQPSQTTSRATNPATTIVPQFNPITWQTIVFILWLVGVMFFSILLLQRILYVRRLIIQSKPAENRFAKILNQCHAQLGIRRHIKLHLSNRISSPAVCGLFQPIILMPTGLIEKLSPGKLRTVLIHELCHIKRCDLWINSAQTILQIMYFYNPLIWLVNVVVRKIREQAVDEMVLVTLGDGAKSYSNILIDIAEMSFVRTSLSLRLIGVVESKKALEGRIKHMLNRPIPKSVKLGIFGLLTILFFGAVLLPMARAQKQSTENIAVNSNAQSQYTPESANVDIDIEDGDFEVIKLSDRVFEATISLHNKGPVPLPRFKVYFYAGDPDKGGRLLSAQQAGPIMPGDTWREYNPDLKLKPDEEVISVIVDPDNRVEESDETNNKVLRSISTIGSESEDVDKVEAIQKVDLAGDDILLVEAQASEGFNFPYYLFIPDGIDKRSMVYILVEPNNSGMVSDDPEVHRAKALTLVKRSYANRMARRLGVPLLVPTFPRPRPETHSWAYTHALDIDTLEITEGELKRIDLQLTAMIKNAQELLRKNGFAVNDKIFIDGFSASAKFCNRYSYLHPEMVKAAAAGGVNGLPTLPVREWNGYELPFPIGIAGIEKFTGKPFDERAFRQVALYIYMGSSDKNDTLFSPEAWRKEEADLIRKALPADKMMPDRWELSRKIYQQQNLHAQLVTYNGVGHSIRSQMLDDVVNFFKANSGENYMQIKPYEYPLVKVEEVRSKDSAGSVKIDIAIMDENLTVTKQPDGSFKAKIDIWNRGSHPFPRFRVDFYAGDPDEGGRLLAPHGAGPIKPGVCWGEYDPSLRLRSGENTISVVVDPDNRVEESDETNNKASAAIPGRQPEISTKPETVSKQNEQKEQEKVVSKASGIDIKPTNFDILFDRNRGTCYLVVDIQNRSNITLPRFKLRFYRGDPGNNLDETGNVQRGRYGAGPIEPGKSWSEHTMDFHLPDGQYDFNVVLDFDNSIPEIDENNNRAELKVKIENGQIAEKSVTCPCIQKDLKTNVPDKVKEVFVGSKIPPEMVGTWLFDNPHGAEEQMAVFPDGRVVVLYSNGHEDKTNIVDGYIELAEYKNARCRMGVREDGTLVEYFGQKASAGKQWRRISPEPHTNLLGALSDSWRFKGKYLAKLSYDVTVELVGICDWSKEGKRCWRPDGSQLPMEIHANKWNQSPEAGLYGFIYKVTGPDDTKVSCKINGASHTEGSCKAMDAFGRQFKDLTASISDMEKGRLSTTVRVGVAAGPWETIASHDGKRMTIARQGDVLWSQAFQTSNDTFIVASHEWIQDQTDRIIAIDKEGKLHTAGNGSIASGKIDQLTASFRNLKLGQIEEFQYQVRPYQWVEFENVSLLPGQKTEVKF